MKRFIKILPFVLILFFGFTETANILIGNWYQQFMPNLNGASIKDMTFTDTLTGYAVTSFDSMSNSFILKTSNGGDNWNIVQIYNPRILQRVKFINASTGFVNAGYNELYKTTNAGLNWNTIVLPSNLFSDDMSVLSNDTIWLVQSNSLVGGVFLTTNGGLNWTQQFSGGNQNPNKIYMYNARLGFISNMSASPNIYRTTNGGMSWSLNLPGENFNKMFFIDSLTGWKANGVQDSSIKKTTNGGLNWFKLQVPYGGMLFQSAITNFYNINRDTIFAVGGFILYPNSQVRGVIYRTTNGGNNWQFQIPDTSIIISYYHIAFTDRLRGWVYSYTSNATGIHTTTGGDTSWITRIQQISNELPRGFKLYQNYPNPFNPKTIINYELRITSYVKLSVYDITGKQIIDLVNQKQTAGTYRVDFSGENLSSGVYFYSLTVGSERAEYSETRKMILLK